MIIPSKEFWPRKEFLEARRAQTEAAKNTQPDAIIVDAGDEIICDSCNDLVPEDGELVNVVDYGRSVVCDKCYRRSYANEPTKYRALRGDGTLSPNEI